MKRFLSIAVSLALCIGIVFMTGCGSVFDGNYTEVTSEEAQTFIEEVSSSSDSDIGYDDGITANFFIKNAHNELTMKFNAAYSGGELQMSGNMNSKVTVGDQSISSGTEYFYKDDTMYMKVTSGKESIKMKMTIPFDEFITDTTGGISGEMAFDEVIAQFINIEGFKMSMDKGDGTVVKVKIEVPAGTVIEGTAFEKLEYYFVFDANYKLTAAKAVTKVKEGEEIMEMELSIESWSGTVNLPGDLDSYVDMNSVA